MNSLQRISDFQRLVNSKAAKIRKEVEAAWKPIELSQSEPRIIYSFLSSVNGGTGYLNRNLAPLLGTNGRTVKFASIFLHQKPMVNGINGRMGNVNNLNRQCELGDLQILFLYLSANKLLCQCRSVIFQAKKKPSSGIYVISHLDQRRLYDECPGFVYSSVLAGKQRWFPRKKCDRERALQYLFVGKYPIQARLIPSDVNQGAFVEFGEFMVRVMNDSTGLDVVPMPSSLNGWSRIVWDQIDNVANAAFGHYGPRNEGLRKLIDRFNSFDDPNDFFHEVHPSDSSEGSGGIPMLLIIVSDRELGSKKTPQIQTDISVEEGFKNPIFLSLESDNVKSQAITDQAEEKYNSGNKQKFKFANIDDLLFKLEEGNPDDQHDLVLELYRQARSPVFPQYNAKKILTVLNRICPCLDSKTGSLVSKLQCCLRSVVTEKVQVFARL